MPFAHKRRHDETTITDFGVASVHVEAILGVSVSILSKAATVKSAVGELIPGQVQSLILETATLACKAGTGRPPWPQCEKQSSRSGLFFLSQSEVASGLNGRLRTTLWTNSILQHC